MRFDFTNIEGDQRLKLSMLGSRCDIISNVLFVKNIDVTKKD